MGRKPKPSRPSADAALTPPRARLSGELWGLIGGLDSFWGQVLESAARYGALTSLATPDEGAYSALRFTPDPRRRARCPELAAFTRPEGATPREVRRGGAAPGSRAPDMAMAVERAWERLRRDCVWCGDAGQYLGWVFSTAKRRPMQEFCVSALVGLSLLPYRSEFVISRRRSPVSCYRFAAWADALRFVARGGECAGFRPPSSPIRQVAELSCPHGRYRDGTHHEGYDRIPSVYSAGAALVVEDEHRYWVVASERVFRPEPPPRARLE